MKNLYKSFVMQAGKGLKNFQYCCHFVKFLTYFCTQPKLFIHIFQIKCIYDFL
jgi:hypothetical protein